MQRELPRKRCVQFFQKCCWRPWQKSIWTEQSSLHCRYLDDVVQLITKPETETSARTLLCCGQRDEIILFHLSGCGPKCIHDDFLALIAMSENLSSQSQMLTNNRSAWTDGANIITSSAYKNIAAPAQLVPILHSFINQLN